MFLPGRKDVFSKIMNLVKEHVTIKILFFFSELHGEDKILTTTRLKSKSHLNNKHLSSLDQHKIPIKTLFKDKLNCLYITNHTHT